MLPKLTLAVLSKSTIQQYITSIKNTIKTNKYTEHSFRAALEGLINQSAKDITAVNDPKRQACGAPDYAILRQDFSVGYIETKDINVNLDRIESSEQLGRYKKALTNLILTNYLEFRWFVNGKEQTAVTLAKHKNGRLTVYDDQIDEFQKLIENFLNKAPEPVATAQDLAQRMARLTDMIRDVIIKTFDTEYAENLSAWRDAFAETLIPGLDNPGREGEFADMYAQTIAYGFFTAMCHHDIREGEFQRLGAAEDIPKTNPLLRDLFATLTGPSLIDEPYYQFVEDLIQLLKLADMEEILKDFGNKDGRTDPVIHFYVTFLKAYDPKLKEIRGVYYTPEAVVSYLVRSTDALLKRDFGLPQGLADISQTQKVITGSKDEKKEVEYPKVLILDPACGTGTFLYQTIDLIRDRIRTQGQEGTWSSYVRRYLLPRLFGFELLMAPYTVAHFKLGMQLAAFDLDEAQRKPWIYDFKKEDRLRVFLTNTLEQMDVHVQKVMTGVIRELVNEGKAANEVKEDMPVLVIMGNPPYSGHSANASSRMVDKKKIKTFIGKLIEDYKEVDKKPLRERNSKMLQDDYVKFIRWAQWRIENTGVGVVAFITNHGYLDNITFRGMRQSLINTFSDIYILDLHGNVRKKEKTPSGGKDKNVFDIKQGVAIALMVKRKGHEGAAKVHHAELWGEQVGKYETLFETDVLTTDWTEVKPQSPHYFFIPWNVGLESEYNEGEKVTDIFPVNSTGLFTARDKLAIQWDQKSIWETIKDFVSRDPENARIKYDLGRDTRDWKVELAQADLRDSGPIKSNIKAILYRPFDIRYTYYTYHSKGFLCMPRSNVMRHMLYSQNQAISTTRSIETGFGWQHVFCSKNIIQNHSVSIKEANYLFPLYLLRSAMSGDLLAQDDSIWDDEGRTPNISENFVERLSNSLHLKFTLEETGDLLKTFGPKDVFHYIYAILHNPSYRARYAQFLKADFPRIPITKDRRIFEKLVSLGKELTSYHLLEAQELNDPDQWITSFPAIGHSQTKDKVEKQYPKYTDGKVYLNKEQYFAGVPQGVWEFRIGGYQVADKWLKDRRGCQLSIDEIHTYQKITLSLAATIRLMDEIDKTVTSWPI